MKRNSRRFAQRQNQAAERTHTPFFSLAHDKPKQHTPFFQAQSAEATSGDKYEKEANQVAAKVSETDRPLAVQRQDISAVQPGKANEKDEKQVQKQTKEEEKKTVQKTEKKEEEKPVQKAERKEASEAQPKHEEEKKDEHPPIMHKKPDGNGKSKSMDISERIKNSKGQGQPLPDKTAKQMEQAFGADFSQVVIHTNGESDALNKEVHSLAFTSGQDIYFASGQYNPDSSSGKNLLAHELTHVIQQNGK